MSSLPLLQYCQWLSLLSATCMLAFHKLDLGLFYDKLVALVALFAWLELIGVNAINRIRNNADSHISPRLAVEAESMLDRVRRTTAPGWPSSSSTSPSASGSSTARRHGTRGSLLAEYEADVRVARGRIPRAAGEGGAPEAAAVAGGRPCSPRVPSSPVDARKVSSKAGG